jgi:hypothetical protein
LEFFRVALLFICQGALLLLRIAATHLEYHVQQSLSTTFLKYFLELFGNGLFPRFRAPLQTGKSYYSKAKS